MSQIPEAEYSLLEQRGRSTCFQATRHPDTWGTLKYY